MRATIKVTTFPKAKNINVLCIYGAEEIRIDKTSMVKLSYWENGDKEVIVSRKTAMLLAQVMQIAFTYEKYDSVKIAGNTYDLSRPMGCWWKTHQSRIKDAMERILNGINVECNEFSMFKIKEDGINYFSMMLSSATIDLANTRVGVNNDTGAFTIQERIWQDVK